MGILLWKIVGYFIFIFIGYFIGNAFYVSILYYAKIEHDMLYFIVFQIGAIYLAVKNKNVILRSLTKQKKLKKISTKDQKNEK